MWFQKINKFLIDSGIELGVLIGGVWGALSSVYSRSITNLWVGFFSFISGTGSAVYMTMLFRSFVELKQEAYYGISFLFGLSGLKAAEVLVSVLIEYINSKVSGNK